MRTVEFLDLVQGIEQQNPFQPGGSPTGSPTAGGAVTLGGADVTQRVLAAVEAATAAAQAAAHAAQSAQESRRPRQRLLDGKNGLGHSKSISFGTFLIKLLSFSFSLLFSL